MIVLQFLVCGEAELICSLCLHPFFDFTVSLRLLWAIHFFRIRDIYAAIPQAQSKGCHTKQKSHPSMVRLGFDNHFGTP